jgi:dTDP-4-dehydrorhamnose 3,5-epimerase
MKLQSTDLADVCLLEPRIFRDQRGFFFESFNQASFCRELGYDVAFMQDNHSCSTERVLRGLHYQIQQAQGKLVRVVAGAIFDVAVDIRRSSPTFGQWVGYTLSAENFWQLWVPAGFAHGFLVLSEQAEVLYKTTDYYATGNERCIFWDDPDLGINWPLEGREPILSAKDQQGCRLRDAEVYA